MIRFSSKIFEDITVEGFISLKAERKFKILRNFELKISNGEKPLLSIASSTDFLKTKYSISTNATGFHISIENDKTVVFDDRPYKLKIESLYPFKKKYADVLLENQKVGEVQFEKKGINITLDFIPEQTFDLDNTSALKISILILLNIADLDGSE